MASRFMTAFVACFGVPYLVAASAVAQTPGRCTGLVCDFYYAGKPAPVPAAPGLPAPPEPPDPHQLPCHDFLCAAFGGRTPDAPPPAPEPVAAPEPAKPVKAAKRKHKAKAVAAAEASQSSEAQPGSAR